MALRGTRLAYQYDKQATVTKPPPTFTAGGLRAGALLGLSANGGLTLTNNNKNQITAAVSSLVENLPTVRGQASQPARLTECHGC